MPDLNDPSVIAAQMRATQMATSGSGRASTMLTGQDGTGTKLGTA